MPRKKPAPTQRHLQRQIDWYGFTGAFYVAGLIMIFPNYLLYKFLLITLPYEVGFIIGAIVFFASSYMLAAELMRRVKRQPLGSFWRSFLD